MNKPTLNILGRKHNILTVTVENPETGEKQTFWDKDVYEYFSCNDKIDFAETIENPSNAQKFIERLENTLNETREYVADLKNQIADTVIANKKLPFAERDDSIDSLVEEVIDTVPFIEGLELSLDIAKGGRSWDVDKAVSEVPSTDE